MYVYITSCISLNSKYHNLSQIDVIVNTTNAQLILDRGPVSRAILTAAEGSIQEECDENFSYTLGLGDVAVTGPGMLDCVNIFHVFIPPHKSSDDIEVKA